MIRVYTASKMHHGKLWRQICSQNTHFIFHARWLKHNLKGIPDSPENAKEFWLEDEQDIKHADIVLVFAEEGEHLRGALVEAGMAIAYGVPVMVIGEHEDYGTWQYHPNVSKAENMKQALILLESVKPRYKDNQSC